jgi:hypothetical protein
MKLSLVAGALAALAGVALAACGGATATLSDDAGADARHGNDLTDAGADDGAPSVDGAVLEAAPDADAEADIVVPPDCCEPPPPAATPACSPDPATFSSPQSVTLTDSTPGATIYYTLDGTNPTPNSPAYSTPLPIVMTTQIRAYALANGHDPSDVASCWYTVNIAGYSND